MSSDKNPEVVGCDASIMRDVWEIRAREYDQKMQQEQHRIEKSALPSINEDWAGRLAARLGGYKRVEPKPRKRVEVKIDDIWKSKETSNTPKGPAPSPLGKPVGQSRSLLSSGPPCKDKKVQGKSHKSLELLMYIGQSQPSSMVWGKSWKQNKCLPSQESGSTIGWGPCWMFAIQQPFSEAGQPWPNGPNKINPCSLHLWRQLDFRMIESQELDLILPTDEWQMSWKKHDKMKQKGISSENGESFSKFFTTLSESQHHNEALCSSEWSDSWRATKPPNQNMALLSMDGSVSDSVVNENDKKDKKNLKWEECWKFVNYQPCNNAKTQPKKSLPPEWDHSWRAAMEGFNNNQNSNGYDLTNTSDNDVHNRAQKESQFHKIIYLSINDKHKRSFGQPHDELKTPPEWSKSWLVVKNDSKPFEENDNASLPSKKTGFEANNVKTNENLHHSPQEKVSPCYEELKHKILYQPEKGFTYSKLFLLKCLGNEHPSSEWRDSWKFIKHRMRFDRQKGRPLRHLRDSQMGEFSKTAASEWKDSWKSPRNIMHQDPDVWQQNLTTLAPINVNRVRELNHFPPVEHPKNGPSGEPGWGESWRFLRRQIRQERQQINQEGDVNSQVQVRNFRGTSDWQPSWMVSETQFHHDNPPLMQWRQSWKCSNTPTQQWYAQMARDNWVDKTMEIQPLKRRTSLQSANGKLSQSFCSQVFRKRYPEKEWILSWSAGSLLANQSNNQGHPEIWEKNSSQQQHDNTTQNGVKWDMSFRISNPMPKQWTESNPNKFSYPIMWKRGKKVPVPIPTNFSNNAATFKVWLTSHMLLQNAGAHRHDKTMSKQHHDPRVIISRKAKTRNHLFPSNVSEKNLERKWAGCHLLGKTQPTPKKGLKSDKKVKLNDDEDTFSEEWAESWRFLDPPANPKPTKSLSGWKESWKCLIPLYQSMNNRKTK